MKRIFLSLGSNTGERYAYLKKARAALENLPGYSLIRASSVYETPPVGGPPQNDFLNQVVEISTQDDPLLLLVAIHRIEDSLGRRRDVRWGPRTIDIDILLYGSDIVQSDECRIPHPRLCDRLFVLVPLNEIATEVLHPERKLTVGELLRACREQCGASQSVRVYQTGVRP
jgi:2-amino-4-hydroxy-6-hydroxymethyldihydropteridine diphosphokinase